ncbi:regulator component [Kitasatospora sp. NPDC101176]|uniref:regulator component n=1 Tax=Kitasatospora sp. NPDC101176 TaxID=3364099 RepID=UPI00382E6CFA
MAFPRGLRRRCERRLAGLRLPDPFTVEAFRAALERLRGRPIVLEPLPALGADLPCGLWIALPSIDVVYYEERTSPAHQDLIKLHELGHVLCGHQGSLDLSRLAALLPDLTPELVGEVLGAGRTSYETAEEQEAEMIALLLAGLIGTAADPGPGPGRLAESLAHPVRPHRWRNS